MPVRLVAVLNKVVLGIATPFHVLSGAVAAVAAVAEPTHLVFVVVQVKRKHGIAPAQDPGLTPFPLTLGVLAQRGRVVLDLWQLSCPLTLAALCLVLGQRLCFMWVCTVVAQLWPQHAKRPSSAAAVLLSAPTLRPTERLSMPCAPSAATWVLLFQCNWETCCVKDDSTHDDNMMCQCAYQAHSACCEFRTDACNKSKRQTA